MSDAAAGHTLIDIVVADPTRGDLVERAARKDMVAATNAKRRKEAHYRDCKERKLSAEKGNIRSGKKNVK